MKISSIVAMGLGAAMAVTFACGQRPSGHVVIGVKDGPPTSSDGRTISSLEVDITRIELEAKGTDGQHVDGGTADNKNEQEEDVTVFNAGSGTPRTIDLLKVTTFSALVADANVPAGIYENARVVIAGARVVFADAPGISVPLVLEGDGKKSKAHYEFKFKPAVTVSTSGTAVAVIDFVPMVQKDGTGAYHLGHDGEHDDSGQKHEGAELEIHGTVASYDAVKNLLTLEGSPAPIDVSTASFKLHGQAAAATDITKGQRAEVEGQLNATTGTLIATKVELE